VNHGKNLVSNSPQTRPNSLPAIVVSPSSGPSYAAVLANKPAIKNNYNKLQNSSLAASTTKKFLPKKQSQNVARSTTKTPIQNTKSWVSPPLASKPQIQIQNVLLQKTKLQQTRLPYITFFIDNNPLEFLIDTGSPVSILGKSNRHLVSCKEESAFVAVNSSPITVFGKTAQSLCIKRLELPHDFYVADIATNLLGNDFFVKYNVGINYDTQTLTIEDTMFPLYPITKDALIPSVNYSTAATKGTKQNANPNLTDSEGWTVVRNRQGSVVSNAESHLLGTKELSRFPLHNPHKVQTKREQFNKYVSMVLPYTDLPEDNYTDPRESIDSSQDDRSYPLKTARRNIRQRRRDRERRQEACRLSDNVTGSDDTYTPQGGSVRGHERREKLERSLGKKIANDNHVSHSVFEYA
jgi:hypothetical protein